MDKKTREKRKEVYDKKKRTKETEIKPGDRVLIAQKKTTTATPFDPKPFTVISVSGYQVTAQRGETVRVRNQAKFKLIKDRPVHLQPRHIRRASDAHRLSLDVQNESDNDDWYELRPTGQHQLGDLLVPDGRDEVAEGGQDEEQDGHVREQQQVAGGHGDLQHEEGENIVESADEEAPTVLRPRIRKKPARYIEMSKWGASVLRLGRGYRRRLRRPRETDFQIEQLFLRGD